MKRNILMLVTVASALVLSVSCNRDIEYEMKTYVTMYNSSYAVKENAGELRIPVLLNNSNGSEVQVSIKLNAGKAQEGVDYELISPANGILTFTGDTKSQDVVLGIKAFEGEFTGNKDFSLEIASLTDNASVGAFSTSSVMIQDIDHPLAAYIGTWAGNLLGMYQSASWPTTINVTADPDGDPFTDLIFDGGINPYFVAAIGVNPSFTATVKDNVVTVLAEQPMGYDDVILLGFNNADPNAADSYAALSFQLQDDGTLVQLNAFGAYTPGGGGFYEIYLGGAVLTKNQ